MKIALFSSHQPYYNLLHIIRHQLMPMLFYGVWTDGNYPMMKLHFGKTIYIFMKQSLIIEMLLEVVVKAKPSRG